MIFQDDTDTYEDFESLALRWRGERFGSVGIVEKQFVTFNDTLNLRSGQTLEGFTLAYETYGTLNEDRSNAVLICHALSGDSHAAGFYTGEKGEKPGWWDHSIGSGKMFDTDKLFVICSNVLSGCQGSSGPSSIAPDGKPYAMRFPFITVSDMVAAQRYLVDYLGIDKLFSVAGGSMGGMQALQWAVDFPERVGSVLFLASTPRASTQNIAFNEIGRQAIYADPNWKYGDYYESAMPSAGLSVARMVGHITYMSEKSLEEKFGRRTQKGSELSYHFKTDFSVEAYLKHQGERFIERFDPNSYLYITKALDYYDVADGYNSMHEALKRTQCPFLVLTISSDWLYTAAQGMELVNVLRDLQREVEYRHVEASFGHDSFLVEVETMTTIVGGYIDRLLEKQAAKKKDLSLETAEH